LAGLILALLAGAALWGALQLTHPVFYVPEEFHAAMGAPIEVFQANRRAQDQVDRHHAMLYIGGLGLLIGAALGLGEVIARRAWIAALAAALLGAAGGALGGLFGCEVYEYVRTKIGQAELSHTILAQFLVAAPIGLGVGLGVGLATRTLGGTLKSALAGIAAGVLAAILYPLAVSMLLPGASTDALLPEERLNRLLWALLLSAAIGLVIPIAGRRRKPNNAPTPLQA
jgi:hypothetical protein